jgi:hypothetical protein
VEQAVLVEHQLQLVIQLVGLAVRVVLAVAAEAVALAVVQLLVQAAMAVMVASCFTTRRYDDKKLCSN